MSDVSLATLPDTRRMEDLSLAYIRAVVAQAGLIVDPITSDWKAGTALSTPRAAGGPRSTFRRSAMAPIHFLPARPASRSTCR